MLNVTLSHSPCGWQQFMTVMVVYGLDPELMCKATGNLSCADVVKYWCVESSVIPENTETGCESQSGGCVFASLSYWCRSINMHQVFGDGLGLVRGVKARDSAADETAP